jgi:hypothetical protein
LKLSVIYFTDSLDSRPVGCIMWVLDKMMRNKKSPARVPDALSVVLSSNSTSEQAAGTFIGLREVGCMTTSEGFSRISKSSSIPNGAEAEDGSPVATGSDWFHVAGLAAVVQGHISEEGLHHILTALSREVAQ